MKVAVINEVSACNKNEDIIHALTKHGGIEIINVGMTKVEQEPQLTYIQTGIMSAILLNISACDFVIGGCGTGQGYLNCVMQFPGVFCGLITEPLDAWLFSQINGGNCVSLALNKGYGWAADMNLLYMIDKLFEDQPGKGYPLARAESQKNSRETLQEISKQAHFEMDEILRKIDCKIVEPIIKTTKFMEVVSEYAQFNELAKKVMGILK